MIASGTTIRSRTKRVLHRAACIAAILALVPLAAGAQASFAPASGNRLLLLVAAPANPAAAAREARFVEELVLALDGVSVERIDLGGGFAFLPLADQLDRVVPIAGERRAAATVWIRESGTGRALLHLVVPGAGRAPVRVAEIDPGIDAQAANALVARQLLRETRVFEPPEPPPSPAPTEADAEAPWDAPAPRPAPAPEPPRPEWGLAALAVAGGGVAVYDGPSVQLGALLGVEWQPVEGLFSRLSVAGKAGPRNELEDGVVTGWGMELALSAGYGWRLGPIALGPFAAVSAYRTALDVSLGGGDHKAFLWWGFRGAAGLDLRIPIGRHAAIVLEGGIGGSPSRRVIERRSDGSRILATPYVDWSAALGFVALLDGKP
ncbi:MAG: hypothetical protein M0R80_20495 [Proteobacteria bacterium]|nr:hypothetical protein [Pseudomonadota bacterium]